MRISLLIATRDRRDSLGRCLEAISRAESCGPLEVIVVDNGSRDGTRAFLDEYARGASFTVVPLREPRPGKSRALNTGLARVTGDLVAFIDDDIYVNADYFVRLREIFSHNDVGYFGGRVLLHDPTDLPITIRTTTTMQLIPPHAFIMAGEIQGCNMAFRRDVLEAIGGFDPMLGPGTPFICEDLDLVARASAAGWAGGFFPELVAYHHHGRKTPAQEAAVLRGYNWGRGAYLAKFVLNRKTRVQYAKRCYWHWRALPLRVLRQEMWGAARYAALRLLTPTEPPPAIPMLAADAPQRSVKAV